MANVTVLGAGAWGTTFGQVLADAGNDVTMWAIEPEIVENIKTKHCNPDRLPNVKVLPDNITAESDRAKAVEKAEIIIVTIAAQFARVALEPFKDLIAPDSIVVSLMKGIEKDTNKRMDQVVCEALDIPEERFACLSGPNLSKEVSERQPTGAIVASANLETAKRVAGVCRTAYFKTIASDDVIGTEMCGSLKNVIALAVGIVAGGGYGENTTAMVQSQGLYELMLLGEAAGAKKDTFLSLAGVGDLIATCASPLSRNYAFGAKMGKGMSREEAAEASNGVAEGVPTAAAVVALGEQYSVATPLASAVKSFIEGEISTCDQMIERMFEA